MKETVQDFVHKLHGFTADLNPNYKTDPNRCQFSVAEYGRVTDWHQCTRKIAEEVDGVGFCKAHAAEVKRRLGKEVETTIRYAAKFSNGVPVLVEVKVVSETDKTINVSSTRCLIGTSYDIMDGVSRKDSRYLIAYKFFDDVESALGYLVKRAEENVENLFKQLEKAKKVYEDLQG